MAADLASVPGLGDVGSWATEEEARLAAALVAAGQAHLFAGWAAGADADRKHKFFAQVRQRRRAAAHGGYAHHNASPDTAVGRRSAGIPAGAAV
jgi:hypothetical protein